MREPEGESEREPDIQDEYININISKYRDRCRYLSNHRNTDA